MHFGISEKGALVIDGGVFVFARKSFYISARFTERFGRKVPSGFPPTMPRVYAVQMRGKCQSCGKISEKGAVGSSGNSRNIKRQKKNFKRFGTGYFLIGAEIISAYP